MKEIDLIDVVNSHALNDCKVHLASWNGKHNPLDVFVSNRDEWKGWNEYRGQRNDFNKKYIFSLIDFYHEKNMWLFGGVYEVVKRYDDRYEVKLTSFSEEYIGRLKVKYKRTARNRAVILEKVFPFMSVSELLRTPYSGEFFPGYENINHKFTALEPIFRQELTSWFSALKNVKGVYLITDTSNGKRCIGSAYGETGVWARWSSYIGTGHGHNDDFSKIIKEHGKEYARNNFVFSLLEYRPMKTDDKTIIDRESYWKEVLLTRTSFGYNNN